MIDKKNESLARESSSIKKEQYKKKTNTNEQNTVKSERLRYENADELYD